MNKPIELPAGAKIHCLKTWPNFYDDLVNPDRAKRKTLEIRLDDREFNVGDILCLREWNPHTEQYSGRLTVRLVTNCLRARPWVQKGYVAMSIAELALAVDPELLLGTEPGTLEKITAN